MSLLAWLLMAIIVLYVALTLLRRKRYDLSPAKAVIFSLLFFLCAAIGNKFLAFLEDTSYFELDISGGSVYGTVVFMPILMWPVCKLMKYNYAKALDLFAPCCALGLAILRINCFVKGCCGAITVYTDSGMSFVPPVQLIECFFLLLFFALLLIAEQKGYVYVKGEQYPKLVIAYGFLRLVMEHYRDTWKHILGMSEGQWFAICTAAAAGIILAILRARKLKIPYDEA